MNIYNPMSWGKSADYTKAAMAPQGYLSLNDDKPWGKEAQLPCARDLMTYDRESGMAMQKGMSGDSQISFPDHYK